MKIKVSVSLGLVGCRREVVLDVDDEDVEDMATPEDRYEYLQELAEQWKDDQVEWDWQEVAA